MRRGLLQIVCDGHPAVGQELILSRGHYGYIAKYRWLPDEDVVLILAVRHQLEAGYAGD
jgi:hypothetical protein